MNDIDLNQLHEQSLQQLNTIFNHYLQNIPALELKMAMHDSLKNTGKLLRPMLIFATGSIFNAPIENLGIAAASAEIMHTYSLIHDDLPCMDDAETRRGKPSCHITHGETMAVLAGDALNTLSFQVIADYPGTLTAARRLQMIQTLSAACGPYGMVAGQALDMTMLQTSALTPESIEAIHRLKTGALFKACIELGRLASSNENDRDQASLAQFADAIGLAFQIQDDLLDLEGHSEHLGKPQAIDLKNNKSTYNTIAGAAKAKQHVEALYHEAFEAIDRFGHNAQLLRTLCNSMFKRRA